jgi:myosin heavy subunit
LKKTKAAAAASPTSPSPVLASKKLKTKPATVPKSVKSSPSKGAPKSIVRGRARSSNLASGTISEELTKARRQQGELMSKLRDQEKELKRLQDMKTGVGNTKSFSQRLKDESSRVEKLTNKLKRMEVLAQEQKKEMLAAGHKRFESAKSTLVDLEPKVGLLEAQYAAQQIELSAIANTRSLEVALLARSNAAMDEGTKALEAALSVGESPTGGISRRNSSVAAVSRILQRRSARLKTSVSEMKQDVRRAKARLDSVKKHTDARSAARSSAAKADAAGLTTALDGARAARKAAAAESQKELESLHTALESARQRAIVESEKDMAEMRRRVGSKRAELEKQAEVMRVKLATAKRTVSVAWFC